MNNIKNSLILFIILISLGCKSNQYQLTSFHKLSNSKTAANFVSGRNKVQGIIVNDTLFGEIAFKDKFYILNLELMKPEEVRSVSNTFRGFDRLYVDGKLLIDTRKKLFNIIVIDTVKLH